MIHIDRLVPVKVYHHHQKCNAEREWPIQRLAAQPGACLYGSGIPGGEHEKY